MATKAELIEQATGLGLQADDGMTNAEIQALIDVALLAATLPPPFVAPETPAGTIPPGYNIDVDNVATFVCPVCHEHGAPEEYAEHAATHAHLLTACVDAVATVTDQAGSLGATEPDVQRALALVSEPGIAEMLAEAPVEG